MSLDRKMIRTGHVQRSTMTLTGNTPSLAAPGSQRNWDSWKGYKGHIEQSKHTSSFLLCFIFPNGCFSSPSWFVRAQSLRTLWHSCYIFFLYLFALQASGRIVYHTEVLMFMWSTVTTLLWFLALVSHLEMPFLTLKTPNFV